MIIKIVIFRDMPFGYNSDKPNISFFRIITNDTPPVQIFPKGAPAQPGITETKYKQFILT